VATPTDPVLLRCLKRKTRRVIEDEVEALVEEVPDPVMEPELQLLLYLREDVQRRV